MAPALTAVRRFLQKETDPCCRVHSLAAGNCGQIMSVRLVSLLGIPDLQLSCPGYGTAGKIAVEGTSAGALPAAALLMR